jgi:putative acetyltransferase
VEIREATPAEARGIMLAHRSAVLCSAASQYSPEVLRDWDSGFDPDNEQVVKMMSETIALGVEPTIVAEIGDTVAGFGTIIPKHAELRALYVHADFGREGVGSAIISRLEELAVQRGLSGLWLAASLNAEAFYVRHGYRVLRRGELTLSTGTKMTCVYMTKALAGQPRPQK